MTDNLKILYTLILVYPLVACSGSSTPNSGDGDQGGALEPLAEVGNSAALTSVNGLVLIQESNGKRTFDAFFTGTPRMSSSGTQIWEEGERVCFRADETDNADFDQALAPVMSATVYAGASIDIDVREGTYLTLEPQVLGDTVVYASDARWTDSELPQDAILSISDSDWFAGESVIALYPMQPIERLEPENGVLLAQASSVRWDGDDTASDQVEVVLSVPYDPASSSNGLLATMDRVRCVLPDTGSFDIPDDVRASMGEPEVLMVSLSRRRSTEIAHQGSKLAVLQISNGQ